MSNVIRVRYAPSPTGHLHIGNARTALFNYLFARHHQGRLIIRIEDTDVKRNVQGGDENQLTYLKWLGIDWDEGPDIGGAYGPYRQTERLTLYQKWCHQLLEQGMAYKCYCTEKELEQEREAQMARGENPKYSGKHRHLTAAEQQQFEDQGRLPSIRFKVPEGKSYRFNDMVKGDVSFASDDFGDFVIVKKDGVPTYNFAVVVDDYLMNISHVLRGDDHISNTPRQLMLYEALDWEAPQFGHMTLIVNENKKKLSKRDETIIQFIEQYEKLGYLPEALFNFIALLGWSPEGEEETFSREELIQRFDEKRLSKSPAVFDTMKLSWMNNHYVKKLSEEDVVHLALPHLQASGLLPQAIGDDQTAWAEALILLYQEQMTCGSDIVSLSQIFFQEDLTHHQEAREVLADAQVPAVLEAFKQAILSLSSWTVEELQRLMKQVQKETGVKGKLLFMPIRVACTGHSHGPDLIKTIYLLGQEKVLSRLNKVLQSVQ